MPENATKENSKSYYGWMWEGIVIVVGCVSPEIAEERINYLNSLKLHLNVSSSAQLPPLAVLDNPSVAQRSGKIGNWLIYQSPNLRAQRFYTVKPLQLDLIPKSEKLNPTQNVVLLNAAISADPSRPQIPNSVNIPSMDTILDCVNIASVVDQLMQGKITTSSLVGEKAPIKHEPSGFDFDGWSTLKTLILAPLKLLRITCNTPIPEVYSSSTSFKDISATLQQLDVRLEQTLNAGEQYRATKPENVQDISRSTARYINFFNCVWLIANDIIIGCALGGFICDNKDALAHLGAQFIQHYFLDLLRESLHWLDNWPMGLKLNTQLSGFLCASFCTSIDYWEHVLHIATPHFPLILYCIGSAGALGTTMILSLISDVLSILTLHTYVCYLLATTVFSRLLKLIGSLYNLFRGKRRNILRNRTDRWNYDMDQLMLGTILFTLVTFLFPTVTVYYMLFTMTRLGIIGMQACLETILAFLNHFPLFALMLRVKDPARLPGGIELRLKTHKKSSFIAPSARFELVLMPFKEQAHFLLSDILPTPYCVVEALVTLQPLAATEMRANRRSNYTYIPLFDSVRTPFARPPR